MARRLRARCTDLGRWAEVVEASAERLPFAEALFDTAVATLVLCTVPEVAAALAEIRRVLRPDGRLLVLEHVRPVDPRLARWQDCWEHPWRLLGAGCHCNHDIAGAIEAGGSAWSCWGDAEGPTDRPAADLSGGPPRAGACWRSWARRRRRAPGRADGAIGRVGRA